MIWIIKGDESHEAISCNSVYNDDKGEVWITRSNGKSLKVLSGTKDEAKELKEAIDFAIKHNEKTFTIE